MLLFTLFTTLTFLTLTAALPGKYNGKAAKAVKAAKATDDNCISSNFNKPWILRDIFVWQALPSTTNATNTTLANSHFTSSSSHISGSASKVSAVSEDVIGNINFLFFDINKDLEMMTECNGALINGATEDKNGGYTLCKNSTVAFKFTRTNEVLLERAYIDPCLGPPPWDGGIAFGQQPTQIKTKTSEGFGVVGTRVRLEVPITSMS